jgi:hypothetical protein
MSSKLVQDQDNITTRKPYFQISQQVAQNRHVLRLLLLVKTKPKRVNEKNSPGGEMGHVLCCYDLFVAYQRLQRQSIAGLQASGLSHLWVNE